MKETKEEGQEGGKENRKERWKRKYLISMKMFTQYLIVGEEIPTTSKILSS